MPAYAIIQFLAPVEPEQALPQAYRPLQDVVGLGQTNAASGRWAITFFGN